MTVPEEAVRHTSVWVSKTDLMRYVRCPYAFWLLDQGEITFEDTVEEGLVRLLIEGIEFQERIEAAAIRIEVRPEEIPALLRQEVTLLKVPPFENPKLKIYGQPDGVEAAAGALFPIEVKSHKDVQRTDELELAFYWLLLEPFRTRRVAQPRGYLILRRDGGAEWVEVPLSRHRFDEVRRLIKEVRDARRNGVRPRICGCAVCSRVKRGEVQRATRDLKDLTLIFGIGRAYARALEEEGVTTWEDLLPCEPQTVVERMRKRGYFISVAEVKRWKRHAESWKRQEAVYFGDAPPVGDSFVALDLEYDLGSLIWLVGACLVTRDRREYLALWADDATQESKNLCRLGEFIAAEPSLPVVTWSGEGADMPQLRHATGRLGLIESLDGLFARHFDLFLHVRRSLRLPIPGLSLKEVAEYFGIPRISGVRDGLQAQLMYLEYRSSHDKKRKATLRNLLLDYNRDDVEALVATAERIRSLSVAPAR